MVGWNGRWMSVRPRRSRLKIVCQSISVLSGSVVHASRCSSGKSGALGQHSHASAAATAATAAAVATLLSFRSALSVAQGAISMGGCYKSRCCVN